MLDRADGFPSFYEGLLVELTVPWESTDIDYFIAMHTPITRLLDGHGVKTLIDGGQRQMCRRKLRVEKSDFFSFNVPFSTILNPSVIYCFCVSFFSKPL